jgi:hypothetical protein
MADPLSQLGISRRPASEVFDGSSRPKRSLVFDHFGTPDTSRPGWSDSARQAVAEHEAAIDEELAIEDERMAAARQREAEAVADEYSSKRGRTARQRFFEERGDDMAASKRYGDIAEYQKSQPSYADRTLAKNIANQIDDPDERNVFLGAVSEGFGTLAAREEADRFRLKRGADAGLAKLGIHPAERKRILEEEGYDDAVVNYYASQKEGGKVPPEAIALDKYYKLLENRVTSSLAANYNRMERVDPKLVAERDRVGEMLSDMYKKSFEPPVPVVPPPVTGSKAPFAPPTAAGATPVAGSETPEQKYARLRKKNNIE